MGQSLRHGLTPVLAAGRPLDAASPTAYTAYKTGFDTLCKHRPRAAAPEAPVPVPMTTRSYS